MYVQCIKVNNENLLTQNARTRTHTAFLWFFSRDCMRASDHGLQFVFIGISIKDLKKNELLQPTPLKMKMDGGRSRIRSSIQQHYFVETGHGIISTAIISLALIQVGQLSITYEKIST